MTRNGILQLLLFFFHGAVQGQNLVPNPSFEHTETYRAHFSNSTLPKDFLWWESDQGSADIFSPNNGTVPESAHGDQYPEHGRNYLGLITASSGFVFYTEKIQAQLTHPLKKGSSYLVSFYVSLADNAAKESNCFQVGFTKRRSWHRFVFNRFSVRKALSPDVYPSDTGWVLVKGIYVATGKEKYINLGNFASKLKWNPRKNMRRNKEGSPHAYYLFDDISVIEIPAEYETTRKDSFQLDDHTWLPNEPKAGDSISIPKFFFTQNAGRANNKMMQELNKLADYLATNPFVIGQLTLAENAAFEDSKLMKLLMRRESELEEYFESKGVSGNRIHCQWVRGRQSSAFTVLKVLY